MTNEILASIPSFYREEGRQITLNLIKLYKRCPEIFIDGIKLDTVYDSFPCIWTGGRSNPARDVISKQEIVDTITPILEAGIGVRYVLTNSLLEQKHLDDINGNNIIQTTLEVLKNYNIPLSVTVYSDLLKEYLQKTYPDIYFVWSTTLGKIGIDEVNRRSEKDMIVLDYNYNNDFEFIDKIKHPENVEILVNEFCVPECQYRQLHWKFISEEQLWPNAHTPTSCINKELLRGKIHFTPIKIVDIDNLQKNYLPRNINKIKINGRYQYKTPVVSFFSDWLIKPEYKEMVKGAL